MQDVAQLAVSLGRGIAEDWPEVALIKIRLNLSSICESSNIISTCTWEQLYIDLTFSSI